MIYSHPEKSDSPTPIRLKSENLSEAVVSWLKQEILKGNYKLGDELPSEQELCDLLGVGKSSIREALKMLQMIGVVEIRQGKRSRICDKVQPDVMMPLMFHLMLQKTTTEEMYNFRVVFDSAVVQYLLQTIDDESLANIEAELERYRNLCDAGEATVEEEFVFHKILLESCHNQYIMQIGMLLLDLFDGPITKAENHDCHRVLSDHQLIVDALRAKDEVALNEAMKTNYAFYKEILSGE